MSLPLDRSKGSDPFLDWKVRLFSVAAVLGLGGIYFDERWMGVGAILLLVAAIALRFLPHRRDGRDVHPDEPTPPE